MSISVFSGLAAFVWFDLALLVCAVLCRRGGALARFGIWPVILILAAGLLRLLCPITLPATRVIHSTALLPAVQTVLHWEPFPVPITLGQGLLVLWSVGTAVCVGRLITGIQRDRQALRRCMPLDNAHIAAIVRDVVGERWSDACRCVIMPEAAAPLMAGFFRPVFVLPAYLKDFTGAEVRLIISHEWQHFRRHSIWWKLAVELLICLMWWNPPVYLLRRSAGQLMEIDCDYQVVQAFGPEEKAVYLNAIVKSLQRQTGGAPNGRFACHLFGSSKAADMKQRFQLVAKSRTHRAGTLLCAACLVLVLAASLCVVVQPFELPIQAMIDQEEIVAFDAAPGSFYVAEDKAGQFVAYFFDVPCLTLDWVCYEFLDPGVFPQYLRLGTNFDSQRYMVLHDEDGRCDPIFTRDDAGELIPVSLPAGTAFCDSPAPSANKDEQVYFFRTGSSSAYQLRLWSATYQRWLTEWEDTGNLGTSPGPG